MQRLTKDNLVEHERVFHGKHGIFYLTRQGANYTDLLPLKNIPKDNYSHQLKVIEIHLQLMHLFPGSMWLSERRIYRDKSTYSVGNKSDHLADGVLILADEKYIAIEVELTMKTKKGIEDIMLSYLFHHIFKEVWYFCSPIIIERVRKAAHKWGHVKIHELPNWV